MIKSSIFLFNCSNQTCSSNYLACESFNSYYFYKILSIYLLLLASVFFRLGFVDQLGWLFIYSLFKLFSLIDHHLPANPVTLESGGRRSLSRVLFLKLDAGIWVGFYSLIFHPLCETNRYILGSQDPILYILR